MLPPPDPTPVSASGSAPANAPLVPYPGTTSPASHGPAAAPPNGAVYQPPPGYPQQPSYPQQSVYLQQPAYAQPPDYAQPVYGPPVNGQPVYGQPALIQPPVYAPPPGYAQPGGPTADATVCIPAEAPHWFLSAEALWLARTDDRDVLLGNAVTNNGGPSFVVGQLTSGDELFPLATGMKLQLGYRINDRDAIELTYFGLQQWSVSRAINGDPIGDSVLAFSPWTQTDALIGGFDQSLRYTYRSSLNNVEINERFGGSGGMTWSVAGLWGLRYIQISDKFNLNGSDAATGDFENIDIKTANNLLGPQVGVQFIRDWNRFQLNTELKAGIYANFITASYSNLNSSGAINGNPAGFVPINQSKHATNVAGAFEIALIGRYRVNDHLWIRGGWNDYFLAGLALGPRQLGGFSHSGGIGLDGPSLGLEAAW
jgi:Legionella pneumophila major outer membrane protein precursor